MSIVRQRVRPLTADEDGYTLVEMIATVAILGVLVAIAVVILLGILEQRRVDAATRQLVSDFRLSHVSATSQMTDWRVAYSRGSPDYRLLRLAAPCNAACANPAVSRTRNKSLPWGTKILSASNIHSGRDAMVEFNSDGTERAFYGVSATVTVSSTDGDPYHRIGLTAATSRIKVD